jgi:hypothetical protein
VHHRVGAGERRLQGVAVADVALAVLELGPAVLGRIERAPGDADDPADAGVVLEQGQQPEAERAGRAGDGDGERGLGAWRHGPGRIPAGPCRQATTA